MSPFNKKLNQSTAVSPHTQLLRVPRLPRQRSRTPTLPLFIVVSLTSISRARLREYI